MNSFAAKRAAKRYSTAHRYFQNTGKKLLHAILRRKISSRRHVAATTVIRGDIVDRGRLLGNRNTSVYVLSAVMFVLLSLSIALNAYEGVAGLLPPLIAAAGIAAACLLWAHFVGTRSTALLFILNFTLMYVGLFLFLRQGAPDGSSLFWFIVFPPMAMVSLGLRHGSVVFACFYATLFLLLFTPLDAMLVHPYSQSIRIRFMLAMFGAFFFSWWVEYLRYRTYGMLLTAMETLERDSLTDHLTGLANRRDFYNTLSRIMAECRRKGEPYVLAILDVDHFKRVNDAHGHQMGDKVLRHITATIASQIRETDRMFRWGGEEFAVLMPACNQEQAQAIAERIRRSVETTPYITTALLQPLEITISIGLYCGDEWRDSDLPIRIADSNLLAAKMSGRNRVVFTDCVSSGRERALNG